MFLQFTFPHHEAPMCIDHIDAVGADNRAEPNASSRQGAHHSSQCLHKSRRKCSSVEKSRFELLLTCNVSWWETNQTSAWWGDLRLSVMPYRQALHHVVFACMHCGEALKGSYCMFVMIVYQMRLQQIRFKLMIP